MSNSTARNSPATPSPSLNNVFTPGGGNNTPVLGDRPSPAAARFDSQANEAALARRRATDTQGYSKRELPSVQPAAPATVAANTTAVAATMNFSMFGGGNEGDDNDLIDFIRQRAVQETKSAIPLKETHVSMLSLLYDPPVEGCQLRPYVAITQVDGSTNALRSNKEGAKSVQFRWFRGLKRVCSARGCSGVASVQCLCCVRSKIPEEMSYFCSNTCLQSAWQTHTLLHSPNVMSQSQWLSDDDEEEPMPASAAAGSACADPSLIDGVDEVYADNVLCKFPSLKRDRWEQVSRMRSYTPVIEDVGSCLRVQCAPVRVLDDNSEILGALARLDTSPVQAAPSPPPPRQMHVVYKMHQPTSGTQFKVICYNVLAQRYATRQMYPYCPLWALSWSYRSTHLLREILSHQAHIICLQEVQANHFDKFFLPQLSKAGYDGLFKAKTRSEGGQVFTPGSTASAEATNFMDGCAIFYKTDRFALTEQYGIEFNEAARQQSSDQQALRRLLRGNIALVVVLEELGQPLTNRVRQRKRRLCVANTHIYWDPEYADVKLWQTYVLCQELEKLVLHRNLALVLCGDFNSLTDSSVYQLLNNERISPDCAAVHHDISGILPPVSTLSHRLPLHSAFAAIGEPKYTNYTGHFVGTLDYIFYSKNHLVACSCLDVDAEELVSRHTALPSPLYSSDHICLVTELDWLLDA